MKQLGEDPSEYNFVFGKPFGRPEEMQRKLAAGEIDTVLLREPEASFAIHEGKGEIKEAFSYTDIWKNLTGDGNQLPNAGLIVKGSLVREHPDLVNLLVEELSEAIRWINENPKEAAAHSYDLMGGSIESLELFLQRVTYKHERPAERIEAIIEYLTLIREDKGFSYVEDNEEVRGLFSLD